MNAVHDPHIADYRFQTPLERDVDIASLGLHLTYFLAAPLGQLRHYVQTCLGIKGECQAHVFGQSLDDIQHVARECLG